MSAKPKPITELDFLGPKLKARLIDRDIRTTDDLRDVSAETLLDIPGLGVSKFSKLIYHGDDKEVIA
jgi:hypothetical protein